MYFDIFLKSQPLLANPKKKYQCSNTGQISTATSRDCLKSIET